MKSYRREQRIICSATYQEIDIIPIRPEQVGRGKKCNPTSAKQARANEKEAKRYYTQLMNANFAKPGVYLVDPTYQGGAEPESFAQADRNLVNYLRRVKAECKRRGLPAPQYLAVTEGGNEGADEGKRLHHHIVMYCPGLSRDDVERLWSTGRGTMHRMLGRINTRMAQPICGSLADRANYMLKAPKHKRRWHQSLGLKKPVRKKPNDNRYTARQIERWAADGRAFDRGFWAKQYPTWLVSEVDVEYNPVERAHYIRLRLWRDRSPWERTQHAKR